MGFYLNSSKALSLYESEVKNPYFVDKSLLLAELFPLVKVGNKHICITRPRRFGKSVMATMVGSFFGKGFDSSGIFDSLKIARHPDYREYLNQWDVIYIDFSEAANENDSYQGFISIVKEVLREDLKASFPTVKFRTAGSLIQDLRAVSEQANTKFIFVLDEWDCIFHKSYTSESDRRDFITFLASLTKGTGYVSLTYMTGVLPIAKYSSGSSINHFDEYTMATDDKYSVFLALPTRK